MSKQIREMKNREEVVKSISRTYIYVKLQNLHSLASSLMELKYHELRWCLFFIRVQE